MHYHSQCIQQQFQRNINQIYSNRYRKRAIDPEDKTAHQFAKLLFERAIPQRKQVEHLGELDAQRLGVNINVITNKAKEIIDESITIEHESVGRQESHGPERLSDGKTHQRQSESDTSV